MSQSPLENGSGAEDSTSGQDPLAAKDYLEGWSATYELLRQGKSWSGHETHNAFLNLGDGRFVDISSIAGLDYGDDGRGLAVVDWNQDGALDLVTSNRTGPQIRFLTNRNASGGHSLTLGLEGRRSNRDAVGARAELFLKDGRRLVRSVRAGDGYLSQSSKWLHFGLGDTTEIDRLEVRWPSGEVEEIRGLSADRWYRLVEGSGEAQAFEPRARQADVESSREAFSPHQAPPLPAPPGRTFLLHPLPLFGLSYASMAGELTAVPEDLPGPLLINLWASWCANCRPELSELQEAKAQLSAAGLDILTVTVDEEKDYPAADAFLDELGWELSRGRSTPELLDYLNVVYEVVVDQPRGMAVPMSFLVDRNQRLLAIYRGPVTPEQLLEDLEAAEAADGAGAVPYPGRWANRSSGRDLQHLANLLRSHGLGSQAVSYLELSGANADSSQWRSESLVESWEDVGRTLLTGGQWSEAEEALRKGLAQSPGKGSLHHALALVLLEQGKLEESMEHFGEALEALPENAAVRADLGFALVRQEKVDEAAEQFEIALELAEPGEEAQVKALYNLAVYRENRGERAEALELLERCLELRPEDFEALRFLGVVQQRAGRHEAAVAAYVRALEQYPDDARTVFYLGQAYIALGNVEGAARQHERLLELRHGSARRLLKDLERLKAEGAGIAASSATETPQ